VVEGSVRKFTPSGDITVTEVGNGEAVGEGCDDGAGLEGVGRAALAQPLKAPRPTARSTTRKLARLRPWPIVPGYSSSGSVTILTPTSFGPPRGSDH